MLSKAFDLIRYFGDCTGEFIVVGDGGGDARQSLAPFPLTYTPAEPEIIYVAEPPAVTMPAVAPLLISLPITALTSQEVQDIVFERILHELIDGTVRDLLFSDDY